MGYSLSPQSLVVSSSRKLVLGSLKLHLTFSASTFSTWTMEPSLFCIQDGTFGTRSLFCRTSLYQYMMSSVVKGDPSDHFIPLRSFTFQALKSADGVTLSASFISIVAPSGPKRASTS